MGVVNCDAQGVRVGWVHAVSPAGTTLNYKLVVAANAVCGIHFLKMFFFRTWQAFLPEHTGSLAEWRL